MIHVRSPKSALDGRGEKEGWFVTKWSAGKPRGAAKLEQARRVLHVTGLLWRAHDLFVNSKAIEDKTSILLSSSPLAPAATSG